MGIATALGLSMTAGLSAFLPIFLIGSLAQFTDWVILPESYWFLQSWWMITISGIFTVIELIADKVPTVDHFWDSTQTFLRPIAGAVLAVGAIGEVNPGLMLIAGVIGGGLATSVHTTKSSFRLMSTGTTGGLANPIISLIEDILAIIGTLMSVFSPVVMFVIAMIFILFSFWFLPRLWNFMVFRFLMWFSWIKYLAGSKTINTSVKPLVYRSSKSKMKAVQRELKPEETLEMVLNGQVWLRRRRKKVGLCLTNQRVLIVAQSLIKPDIWSYSRHDVAACHVDRGIAVTLDLSVNGQILSFDFFKTAQPYINFFEDTIRNRVVEANR